MPAIRRENSIHMSDGDRVRLAHACAAQETRAWLLATAQDSPQARRLARAMEALTDFLWPDDSPRVGEERNER
jgi:hypothetical protein